MSLTDLDIQFIEYALMAFAYSGGAFLFLSLWFSPAVSVLIILVAASSAASITATSWGSFSLASIDPTGLAVVIISMVATMVSGFAFYRLSNTINPLRLLMFGAVYLMFTGYMVTMNYLLIAQMLERGSVINDRAQAQESMVLDLQGQIGEANATLLRAQSELSEISAQDRALTEQIAREAQTGCPDTLRNGQPSNCKTLKDQKAALVPAREAAQSALATATATIERLQAQGVIASLFESGDFHWGSVAVPAIQDSLGLSEKRIAAEADGATAEEIREFKEARDFRQWWLFLILAITIDFAPFLAAVPRVSSSRAKCALAFVSKFRSCLARFKHGEGGTRRGHGSRRCPTPSATEAIA